MTCSECGVALRSSYLGNICSTYPSLLGANQSNQNILYLQCLPNHYMYVSSSCFLDNATTGVRFALCAHRCHLTIPVPLFACRVRELQVERVHRLGYHTFFLARVLSDERLADVSELCVAHGFYQDWRVRNLGVHKRQAAAEDLCVRSPISRESAERISAQADLAQI
jgi:hypothetical protein